MMSHPGTTKLAILRCLPYFSTEPGTPKILQFRGDLHPHDDQVVQVLGSIQYIVSTKMSGIYQ